MLNNKRKCVIHEIRKGKDKVTGKSAKNDYEKEGIKMIDIESIIESLRLAWLKIIFSDNSGAWKHYLGYVLKETGGLVLFNCNYNVKIPNYQFSIHYLTREFRVKLHAKTDIAGIAKR